MTRDAQVAPSVAIFGQQLKRCDVHLAPEFLMFRVHFQPGALFRMLNIPLYEFGYTDYQHMVRDFRQFTNATPNEWLLEDGASPEKVLTRTDSA